MQKRSSTGWLVAVAIVLATLAFRLLPRYEVKTYGAHVHKVDRWTGTVLYWNPHSNKWTELKSTDGFIPDPGQ